MTTDFNPLNLPSHIHVERSGRGKGGVLMAALVCDVCASEEEAPDTPEALRATAGRFVPSHMECTPATVEQE